MDYSAYYQSIIKPSFAPPEWAFGLAWGIIYPLIALAFIYTLVLIYRKRVPARFAGIFAVNLIANILFTPIQLGLMNTWLATLDIFLILATLILLVFGIYRYSKLTSLLLVPYLLWVSFATVLQVSLLVLN